MTPLKVIWKKLDYTSVLLTTLYTSDLGSSVM